MSDADRIRELAVLFNVPDGGRYLNDWRERAAICEGDQERALTAESALAAAVAQADTLRQALEAIEDDNYLRERYDSWKALSERHIQCARAALSVSPSQGRVLTDDECEQMADVLHEAETFFAVHDLERTDGRMSPIRHRIDQALRLLVPARAGGKATASSTSTEGKP